MPSELPLRFVSSESLPKLAWLAEVDLGALRVTVLHGPWVEVFDGGFVEGVWDGPFADAELDRAACLFGSGAIVRG